jgi:hypothetical protein
VIRSRAIQKNLNLQDPGRQVFDAQQWHCRASCRLRHDGP